MKAKPKTLKPQKPRDNNNLSEPKTSDISIDQLVLVLLIVVFYATAVIFGTIKLPSIVDVVVLITLLTMLLIPTIWLALNMKQPPVIHQKPELPEITEVPEASSEEYFGPYDLASMKAPSDMIH